MFIRCWMTDNADHVTCDPINSCEKLNLVLDKWSEGLIRVMGV